MGELEKRKHNFLLEIGTEELPASYIPPALEQLRAWGAKWAPPSRVIAWGTPRRLLLFIKKLPRFQSRTVWGPPRGRAQDGKGTWNKNAFGFARSHGRRVEDLGIGVRKGKQYLKLEVYRDQKLVLCAELRALLHSFSFPKSMRWVPGDPFRFARPIRWLVLLWGDEVMDVQLAGLRTDRYTRGHRFFGGERIKLRAADLNFYKKALEEQYVIADQTERRKKLIKSLIAQQKRYWPEIQESDLDAELVDEVSNLVEYPRVIRGDYEESFLKLPSPVLITVMKSHQRYFPVRDAKGKLLPKFLVVANGPYQRTASIRENNERVLRARLADAGFFWKEDLCRSLEARVSALEGIIFHERLGSYHDKVKRVQKLTAFIARQLGMTNEQIARAKRSALLSKSDLTCALVMEFPELQGTIGREYARQSGEELEVAEAMGEQYLPRSAEDGLPQTKTGLVLALADKIDTVVSFLSAGIRPSGSQDPYGLRRRAQGAIRLIAEKQLPLSFSSLAEKAVEAIVMNRGSRVHLLAEVLAFFRTRMEAYLETENCPPDVARAVLASGWDDFQDVLRRVKIVEELQGSDALMAATTIVERTYNIYRDAGLSGREAVKKEYLQELAERELFEVYVSRAAEISSLIEEGAYRQATETYARTFSRPLHHFFDEVMVNVDKAGLRKNRLVLLEKINRLYTEKVADLALLQFERGEYIL